ncbi:MAG: hypothetical protein K6U87_00665 [Firmicutes bacterium]|jgi:hypothetical protein|nr:hypothetical protein [Bacillota bacterium]
MNTGRHSQSELNRIAWSILVQRAANRDLITYQELADEINKVLGTKYTHRHIGQNALDRIENYCLQQGYPDLTALVVEKTGDQLPGKNFFEKNGILVNENNAAARRYHWIQIRDAVWSRTWSTTPPPTL